MRTSGRTALLASPICIGQAQGEGKTYKKEPKVSLSRVLARSSTLFSSCLWVGMPLCFEDEFSCYLLNKIEV